ncbi:DsrE family protein [Nitrospina sp. 32_T5]|uniref:DsrE family protein n=1 Tax=unclassified Nitrospina TaxID=2638683 RepID=UPI003F9AA699
MHGINTSARFYLGSLFLAGLLLFGSAFAAQAETGKHRTPDGKLKVLYHIDGNDVAVAKYAMALVKKHIEAEGGMDKIDIKVVVHGPALMLFDRDDVDPELKAKLKSVMDMGVEPEMCQVSMKLFGRPLDRLVAGFIPTEHPVAVKRIADLQEQGYLYIKP